MHARLTVITLRDVIALPAVQNGQPIVELSEQHLERPVRWAHVIEVGQPAGLLRGGELVFTTCVGIEPSDVAAQERFVQQLDDQGACAIAGLGEGLRRALPPCVLSAAAERGLPVVRFHYSVRFVDVIEAIQNLIMGRDLMLLQRIEDLRGRLSKLVLDGHTIRDTVEEVSRTLECPMTLSSWDHQVIHYAAGPETLDAAAAMWQRIRTYEEAGDPLPPGVLIAPVSTPHGSWGRLVCFSHGRIAGDLEGRLLAEAAQVIGLQLLGGGESEFSLDLNRSFFDDLARGIVDDVAASRRARSVGFRQQAMPLLPLAAAWRGEAPQGGAGTPPWASTVPELRRAFDSRGFPIIVGGWDKHLMLVVGLGGRPVTRALLERMADIFYGAIARDELDEKSVALAIGAAEPSWTSLGYRIESLRIVVQAATLQPAQRWYDARRMSVDDFLYTLVGNPVLLLFVRQHLGRLLEPGDRRSREMLTTLNALTEHGGRKADAARHLHLNRQSFYYRLDRIEEVLGVDLNDDHTRAALHLALRALPLLRSRQLL